MPTKLSAIRAEIEKLFFEDGAAPSIPIWTLDGTPEAMARLPEDVRNWLKITGWKNAAGMMAVIPGNGAIASVVLGLGEDKAAAQNCLLPGALPPLLPEGDYHFAAEPAQPELAAVAWALGAYTFDRYRTVEKRTPRRLRIPAGVPVAKVLDTAQAVWLARDLINVPTNDKGPGELEAAMRELGGEYGAKVEATVGDDLLKGGFRLLHAVGRASDRAPRLVDLNWGSETAPKLTLVGKGICFDTGGLNLKPGNSMALMKKDMGGAATAMALAAMIMAAKLPVRLRLLVPAAENNVSANAYRPGDLIKSRNGLTVEIGNTDAEGRLVLADALSLACEDKPDTLVVFATLTGAARVALGPDLPAFFTDDDGLAEALSQAGLRLGDPVWRLPLWSPYDAYIKSEVADINNSATNGYAGSITAALFLKRFVKSAGRFLHFDLFGWTPRALPGKPMCGEPQTARALFDVLSRETRN
jgi:leucyl aminopeptidase